MYGMMDGEALVDRGVGRENDPEFYENTQFKIR
jgi:hypothetical protein